MKICVLFISVAWTVFSAAAVSSLPQQGQHANADGHSEKAAESKQSNTPPPGASDQERVQELNHRVEILEIQLAQRSSQTQAEKNSAIIIAIIGAAAVFGAAIVAALLGIVGQTFAAKRAARLASNEALYRNAERVLEFRMKQVQEFYAPIFALLRQSRDLYDKMLEQLVQDEPGRYRKVPAPTGKDFRWEVTDKNGTWQGFRLLDQFPAIKENAKALALADANLVIGAKICELISTRAGYASEALVDMLGQYMAHHAILSTVRSGPETEPFEPGWHKVGYFPFGLDKKIGEAYHDLAKSIDEYGKVSTQTLEALGKASR